MVRSYKKKTNRCDIDEDDIKKAVNDVRAGTYSCRHAAVIYNIKRTTLLYRLKKLKEKNDETQDSGAEDQSDMSQKFSSKYTSRQVFTNSEELLLVEYLQKCCNLNYGLNYRQVRSLAYEYALRNRKKMPKEWEDKKIAGRDWILNFMKRHKDRLSLRKPENTSLARIKGFNKQSVTEFYENLEKVLREYNFEPSRILNLDETGITTVLDQPRVVATLGQKQVGQVVSAERGSLITFVGIISASGNSAPPVYIFPRVRLKDSFMKGTPVGSLGLCNKSGWITAELFLDVLKHIKKHFSPKPESGKYILLLMDNHDTHVTVSSVEFCRENGIVLLSFPPHTSHKIQPLDVGVFGAFKAALKRTLNNWMINNVGRTVSLYDIGEISSGPFLDAFTPKNILAGFRKPGIYPFNPNAFKDSDFVNEEPAENYFPNNNPTTEISSQALTATINDISEILDTSNTSITSSLKLEKNQIISPAIIRPVPTMKTIPKSTKGREKRKSTIYTDSPEYKKILERNQKKREKEAKKKGVKRDVFNKKRKLPESSDESDADSLFSLRSETSLDNNSILELTDDQKIEIGNFVLVQFPTKTTIVYYIGKVLEEVGLNEFKVKFLRRKFNKNRFFYPEVDDIPEVNRHDIIAILPNPILINKYLEFDVILDSYNIK